MQENESKQTMPNAQKPKEELFFHLFMTYQRNFYAYILSSVHNYTDANDLLQETAAVMWRKFDEFQQGSSFLAWGITIAQNLVLKFFNEHKRSRIQFDDALLKDLADTTLDEMKNADALTEALRQCFQKLNETNQKLLRLRYQDGMTIKAIAAMVGKPVFGMYKAFARLQDALQVCIENTLRREGAVE